MFTGPHVESVFPKQISQGLAYNAKVANKFLVVTGEAEETMELLHIGGRRPRDNGINLTRVSRNTSSTNNVTQVRQLLLGKRTLRQLGLYIKISSKIHNTPTQQGFKSGIHSPLKRCWSTRQAERRNPELKVTLMGRECCLMFFPRL